MTLSQSAWVPAHTARDGFHALQNLQWWLANGNKEHHSSSHASGSRNRWGHAGGKAHHSSRHWKEGKHAHWSAKTVPAPPPAKKYLDVSKEFLQSINRELDLTANRVKKVAELDAARSTEEWLRFDDEASKTMCSKEAKLVATGPKVIEPIVKGCEVVAPIKVVEVEPPSPTALSTAASVSDCNAPPSVSDGNSDANDDGSGSGDLPLPAIPLEPAVPLEPEVGSVEPAWAPRLVQDDFYREVHGETPRVKNAFGGGSVSMGLFEAQVFYGKEGSALASRSARRRREQRAVGTSWPLLRGDLGMCRFTWEPPAAPENSERELVPVWLSFDCEGRAIYEAEVDGGVSAWKSLFVMNEIDQFAFGDDEADEGVLSDECDDHDVVTGHKIDCMLDNALSWL